MPKKTSPVLVTHTTQSDKQALLEALKDAVRWLDAIHAHIGSEMISVMPNGCLGRPAMRQVIADAETR